MGNKQYYETHGMKNTTEYKTWENMKKRCYTLTCREYNAGIELVFPFEGVGLCLLYILFRTLKKIKLF